MSYPASSYPPDGYYLENQMFMPPSRVESIEEFDTTDYFRIESSALSGSSPSPAPRRHLVPQGSVRDYMDEYDDITQFEEPQMQHNILNSYHDPAQNLGYPGSQTYSSQSNIVPQDINSRQQGLDAYIHISQPQNYPRALPTHSHPVQNVLIHPGSNPRNSHGIPLKPVSTLPDIYRSFFKFGVFNAIQSRCYDTIMNTHDNMVVSAPTGSGKTVLFELALICLLMEQNSYNAKCVYMAPTKALCSERYRDWTTKLDPIGIKCCELTGDTTGFGRNAWGDAKNSSVIITTPEKFDSLSRNWYRAKGGLPELFSRIYRRDHSDILSQTKLFLIDEVHILNESRGSTLEVVTSRVKAKGISVRFLMVSATVPNIEDIAAWIGNGFSEGPATVFNFGDEFRPCKLTRVVYGYPRKSQNDFSFSRTLDYKLLPLLQKHAENKPVLIFCATRKGVIGTAEVLMKEYQNLVQGKQTVPWAQPRRIDATFQDSKLQELAISGIGVHHAGLTLDDRRATEDLFIKKIIRVVVATSTLAVGVNLPAHTVVVKGVKMWMNGEWQEYSDLDFIQMIGRAGRPQFDNEGVAVILCDTDQERKYKALISGQTLLESCLHSNLPEHLNSEIGLSTITDLTTAKEWLHNSFLFQRIQKNPRHYALNKASDQTWQSRLDELVESSIGELQKNELVSSNGVDGGFSSTEYGEIMSKYYIRLSTMEQILKLPEKSTLRDILEMIASAGEIDLRLRAGEKRIYKNIGDHNDIRFRTKVEGPSDKVFILIQAVLGGISLNSQEYKTSDSQPYLEALTVFKHAARIARTIVEVAIVKQSGATLKHGMELVRSLTAKAWEDRPMVLRQIEQIGEKSIKVLAENGVTTLAALRQENPARIEILLNRRPPFGNAVLAAARELPQYDLKIVQSSVSSFRGKKPVVIELNIECGLASASETKTATTKGKKNKLSSLGMTAVLTLTSDNDFVDFRRIPTKALREPKSFTVSVKLTKPSQTVITRISPDNFAGLTVTETYRPSVSSAEYPTPDTRPASYDVDAVLAGLEDDPTFWNIPSGDFSGNEIEYVSSDPSTPQPKHKDIPKAKSASKLDQKTKIPPEPVTSSNGKYECLHTCKDKTKCRHFCCRDGLAKPPKKPSHLAASGASQTSLTERNSKVTSKDGFVHIVRPEDVTKAKQKTKRSSASDIGLKHLESLHQRAGGLELPGGRRLKLESGHSAAMRKPDKQSWNTDLTFTDIERTVRSDAIHSDDEGLPDPRDVLCLPQLKPDQVPVTEQFYGDDSGLDKYGPNVQPILLDGDDDGLASRKFKGRESISGRPSEDVKNNPTTNNARRRPRSTSPPPSPSLASKRPRLYASLTDSSIAKDTNELNHRKPSNSDTLIAPKTYLTETSVRGKNIPLFVEAPDSDELHEIDAVMYDDDVPFAFDLGTFDMEPTTSFTPVASQSLMQRDTTPWIDEQHTGPIESQKPGDHLNEEVVRAQSPTVDGVTLDDYAQGLAEFEAWLQSGGVEITEGAV